MPTWMNGVNWEAMSILMIAWLVLIGLIGYGAMVISSQATGWPR